MVSFEQLNPQQKEAVISDAQHLRIIAGAGSGKTRVLTMRIAYLIQEKNILPYHILAITFTNKAANEMKRRMEEMLAEKADGCFISTIHSLCMRILKEDIEVLGYPRNFTIADSDDQKQILKEAYKRFGIENSTLSYGKMLGYISNVKSAGMSIAELMKSAIYDEDEEKKVKVYEYYCRRLQENFSLDFDDLILWTLRLFDEFPSKKEKWAKRFRYVLVDEFQDIDKQQYRLIRDLASAFENIYVVGDPDQTIYTWRGADVNIIIDFEKDYPNTQTIVLNQNYRSTNNILSGANSLIQHNRLRIRKELFSQAGDGEKIIHKTLLSEEAEAYYVISNILELRRQGKKLQQMAILYRSNYLSRTMEKILIENKLPYIIYGGIRFYERAEIKDILSYLRLISNGDDLAFIRVINTPKRGIGTATIEKIHELAEAHQLPMYEVIKQGLYPKISSKMTSFVAMIEKWRTMLENHSLEEVFHAVLEDSGYREMLTKDNETERLENVKSLLDDILSYQKNNPEASLADYIQTISLYTDKENSQHQEAIPLMTIHAAKGLEFDVVFVIGLSEGIFPSDRSVSDGIHGLEEERRLAYVAYTRAREKLILSDNSGFSYVTQGSKQKSRFIQEIDEKFLEDISESPRNSEGFRPTLHEKRTSLQAMDTNYLHKKKNSSLRKGDLVIHSTFQEGVVIDIKDNFATIAFAHPVGIKKVLATHPALQKKDHGKN